MKLEIEYLTLDQLKPYANNARAHHPDDVRAIENSIREFGFDDPIGIWGENEIVEGHGRNFPAGTLICLIPNFPELMILICRCLVLNYRAKTTGRK